MGKLNARREEYFFHALSQSALRRTGGLSKDDWLISKAYDWGSNYGLSLAKPMKILLGIFLSTSLFLSLLSWVAGTISWEAAWDTLIFSAKQTVIPFEALRARELDYAFDPFCSSEWLRAWSLVQTLISAYAVLLLILAVRWRYKR